MFSLSLCYRAQDWLLYHLVLVSTVSVEERDWDKNMLSNIWLEGRIYRFVLVNFQEGLENFWKRADFISGKFPNPNNTLAEIYAFPWTH